MFSYIINYFNAHKSKPAFYQLNLNLYKEENLEQRLKIFLPHLIYKITIENEEHILSISNKEYELKLEENKQYTKIVNQYLKED